MNINFYYIWHIFFYIKYTYVKSAGLSEAVMYKIRYNIQTYNIQLICFDLKLMLPSWEIYVSVNLMYFVEFVCSLSVLFLI